MRPRILLITPARESDNNGNYHTAHRWLQMLSPDYEVTVAQAFSGQESDLMIALHARRSALSIVGFQARNPTSPVLLTLTGTDLYKDLPNRDPETVESMRRAAHWIVLQEDAPHFLSQLEFEILPPGEGRDIHVVFQSAPAMVAFENPSMLLNVAFVGHLREEKDPRTLFNALRLLEKQLPIAINAAGNGLDNALAAEASQLAASDQRFAWLGGMSHEKTRELIRQADILVVPSRMEGGANVIAEALAAGTPVAASAISGNIGMLGRDWPAYFPVGNAAVLAELLRTCITDKNYLLQLRAAAAKRAPLFSPESERTAIRNVVAEALVKK
jgi:putative glycosyltransferase (TIGR04348 family)